MATLFLTILFMRKIADVAESCCGRRTATSVGSTMAEAKG